MISQHEIDTKLEHRIFINKMHLIYLFSTTSKLRCNPHPSTFDPYDRSMLKSVPHSSWEISRVLASLPIRFSSPNLLLHPVRNLCKPMYIRVPGSVDDKLSPKTKRLNSKQDLNTFSHRSFRDQLTALYSFRPLFIYFSLPHT